MIHQSCLASVLAVFCVSPPAVAQLIRGRLLEDGSDRPILSAQITLRRENGDPAGSVLTDATGRFRLTAPGAGSYTLSGTRLGYRTGISPPFRLITGDTLDIEFRLSVSAVLLAPLTVTATARDWIDRYRSAAIAPFYERQHHYGRMGLGKFVTREQFKDFETMPLTLYLSSNFAGVQSSGDGAAASITMRNGCTPQFYLNGARFPLYGENLDAIIKLSELEAIEVYRGASEVPGEFAGSTAECGVIVLWTRRTN